MRLIDADALKAKWYEINDIDENDRGARFVGYTEIARLIDEAPTIEPSKSTDQNVADVPIGETISREEAIEAFDRGRLYHKSGIEEIINTLPSADTKRVLQGYCKGANCKWWNQQVNGCNRCVMIQDEYKHTSADRPKGEWITDRKPKEDGRYMVTLDSFGHKRIDLFYYGKPMMPNRKVRGKCWYRSDDEWGDVVYDDEEILAWLPLPKPYREENEA